MYAFVKPEPQLFMCNWGHGSLWWRSNAASVESASHSAWPVVGASTLFPLSSHLTRRIALRTQDGNAWESALKMCSAALVVSLDLSLVATSSGKGNFPWPTKLDEEPLTLVPWHSVPCIYLFTCHTAFKLPGNFSLTPGGPKELQETGDYMGLTYCCFSTILHVVAAKLSSGALFIC